jgi:hypothetical protein
MREPGEEDLDVLGPDWAQMPPQQRQEYARTWEPADDPETGLADPTDRALDEIDAALDETERPEHEFWQWPFGCVSELTGGMTGAQVWVVTAFRGKTLFLTNCLDAWMNLGAKVYVLALETTRGRFRLLLASMRVGVDGGLILNGTASDSDKARVRTELLRMRDDPRIASQLYLHSANFLTPAVLREGLAQAKAFGADLVAVDHLDHLRPDAKMGLYEQSVDVVAELHDRAISENLLVVCTSQLNDRLLHTRNHLGRYAPPVPHLVFNGTHKYNVATGMLGLYKPLRKKKLDETPEEFRAALQAAANGTAEPQTVLEANTMGITLMKGRHGVGAKEGRQAFLRLVNGRLSDIPVREFGRVNL